MEEVEYSSYWQDFRLPNRILVTVVETEEIRNIDDLIDWVNNSCEYTTLMTVYFYSSSSLN